MKEIVYFGQNKSKQVKIGQNCRRSIVKWFARTAFPRASGLEKRKKRIPFLGLINLN